LIFISEKISSPEKSKHSQNPNKQPFLLLSSAEGGAAIEERWTAPAWSLLTARQGQGSKGLPTKLPLHGLSTILCSSIWLFFKFVAGDIQILS
jgi:hypothetical protein